MEKVAAPGLLLGAFVALLIATPVQAQLRRPGTAPADRLSTKRPAVAISRDYEEERNERRTNQTFDFTRPNGRLIEMSFRFAPSFSYNTAEGTGSYSQFQTNGVGVRMSVGPSLDYFFFRDRYAFSSGLWYTIKRSSFVIPGSFGQDVFRPGQSPGESVYNLQYLQIPLTVKMYANEIGPSLRGYVQCGGLIDIKLAEKPLDQTTNPLYKYATSGGSYQRQYGFADVGVLLGAGVQYKINAVNAVNLGLSYQRGLVNVFRNNSLESRNNTVAIEMGFKF
ncbi:outer membrane beta-barrel protein [uncultured Fibrella sp.]|uniref:outer membrane beta-barrel protein n=1 Tax=uncultured Fibrella sp. TaxID=1284596 RepID=UPI0035CB35A6